MGTYFVVIKISLYHFQFIRFVWNISSLFFETVSEMNKIVFSVRVATNLIYPISTTCIFRESGSNSRNKEPFSFRYTYTYVTTACRIRNILHWIRILFRFPSSVTTTYIFSAFRRTLCSSHVASDLSWRFLCFLVKWKNIRDDCVSYFEDCSLEGERTLFDREFNIWKLNFNNVLRGWKKYFGKD